MYAQNKGNGHEVNKDLKTSDTYAFYCYWFQAALASNTPSNFALVRGVPSHSLMLTRSFMMVNKLETYESAEPYSDVMLHM
jgi:hypothetical protein